MSAFTMTPAYPPHHIKSVSVNSDGWLVPSTKVSQEVKLNEIAITSCCRLLLDELKLDLDHAVFRKNSTLQTAPIPSQELHHAPSISAKILTTISTIRKMGDTVDVLDKKKSNMQRKVASLEEQRRIRKQKEQEGRFVSQEEHLSPDKRFAMTFNSLRVIVPILRSVLTHPWRQDYTLKMNRGPSIEKPEGNKKVKKRARCHYLLFEHVYDVVTSGEANQLSKAFDQMMHEVDPNSSREVFLFCEKNGQYQFDIVRNIQSIVERGQSFEDKDTVANMCFANMPKIGNESKLHAALIGRFDYDKNEKQIALQNSIARLQEKLTAAISQKVSKDCRLTVYGSCLSGLTLEGSHDVDVSVYVPQLYTVKEQFDSGRVSAMTYARALQNVIYKVRNALLQHADDSFVNLVVIARARIPVIKGVDQHACNPYSDGGHLHFDLCFLNEIAVKNSSLLREYSLLDQRARVLMLCVKSFAKKNSISSAADATFSSYSWLNLVVFYLQCIGFLPTLQCPQLMQKHNFKAPQECNTSHSINSLETHYLSSEDILQNDIWKQPPRFSNTTIPELLYGFFKFYADVFPQQTVVASIRVGSPSIHKSSFQKSSRVWRMSLEDPFETWDSHCPHDLGSPLTEKSQEKIMNYFITGLKDLHRTLEAESNESSATNFLFDFIGCDDSNVSKHASNGVIDQYLPQRPNQRNGVQKQRAKNGKKDSHQKSHSMKRHNGTGPKIDKAQHLPHGGTRLVQSNGQSGGRIQSRKNHKGPNNTLNALHHINDHLKDDGKVSKPKKNRKEKCTTTRPQAKVIQKISEGQRETNSTKHEVGNNETNHVKVPN